MRSGRVRISRWLLALGGVTAAVIWALGAQATTRQGVNFQVSTRQVPLSVKALAFLHRDAQYQLVARQITKGLDSDAERVRVVLDWTRRTIRPTPRGWPIVDDHVLHILIRGHGTDDQMADVFTTLSTYAGVPAFWRYLKPSDTAPTLTLSFARVDGVWTVFDVANGIVFADPDGQLVDVQRLATNRPLVESITQGVAPGGISYWVYLERLRPFMVPDTLRAQQQMPWPRLIFEVRKRFAPA